MKIAVFTFISFFLLVSDAIAVEVPAEVYTNISNELFQSMKKNETVAIQPLSEEETKIPAAVLRSIEVSLTSALQRASDFEVKLIARDRLQVIWKEAREFQKKKFEDMVAEAGADVLLIGEVRPTSDGVEISYRAFRVKGTGTGTVIASSKPRVLAFDWKKELGVQPTQISDAMKEMAEAMKRLAASGGLVADAKTSAEWYHNARMLAQRGEVDLAFIAYENVMKLGTPLFDPIKDLVDLAVRQYGKDGAKLYVEKKLSRIAKEDAFFTAKILVADDIDNELAERLSSLEFSFLPVYVAYLDKVGYDYINDTFFRKMLHKKLVIHLSNEYSSGRLQNYYLDQIRAAAAGDNFIKSAKNLKSVYDGNSGGGVSGWQIYVQHYVSQHYVSVGLRYPVFYDRLDLSKPIILCASKNAQSNFECKNIVSAFIEGNKKFGSSKFMTMAADGSKVISEFNKSMGFDSCALSVQYVDARGRNNFLKATKNNYDMRNEVTSKWDSAMIEQMRRCFTYMDEIDTKLKSSEAFEG